MGVSFLDLAQQCAPQIAVETLAAVVSVESSFQPFTIRINSDYPLAEQPKSQSEAIETATILMAEGNDIDLGLSGINAGDLSRLGLSVSDSFDFCLNLKASASLLDGYYRAAVQGRSSEAHAVNLMLQSYYGRGDASLGEMVGYDRQVLAEREQIAGNLATLEIAEQADTAIRSQETAGEPGSVATEISLTGQGEVGPQAPIPRWDVFNPGRRSSVLVFSNDPKE